MTLTKDDSGMNAKELLIRYRDGNLMSNEELEFLRIEMQNLGDLSMKFGDIFLLQAIYAHKVARACASYLRARSA